MEASQASEAGSIPVARSSPARPCAGRFCYAHFAPTVNAAGQSAQHFPRASWGPRFRYKTRPARGARCQFRYKTRSTRAARCQFRYKTRPARGARCQFRYKTHPASPKSPNLARFALAGSSFIPFLLPTSRAWRVFSRTNTSTTTGTKETTPPHNTQSHAMKDYPPTLHRQHHTMKYSSPQHATNNRNSLIFTMQGRTFFHNTHHTPTPGRHFFQPTPLPAK